MTEFQDLAADIIHDLLESSLFSLQCFSFFPIVTKDSSTQLRAGCHLIWFQRNLKRQNSATHNNIITVNLALAHHVNKLTQQSSHTTCFGMGQTNASALLTWIIHERVLLLTSSMESQAVIWLCREAIFWLSLMSDMSAIRKSTTVKCFCLRPSNILKPKQVLVEPPQLESKRMLTFQHHFTKIKLKKTCSNIQKKINQS